MSIVLRNRNLPSFVNDFFTTSPILTPAIFDFDGDLLDFESTDVLPEANIVENDKNYKIDIAAPGLDKKDFKVEITNHTLTVSAEKETEEKEERENYKRREFSYNSFSRSFNLPDNSLPEKIDAKYDSGILHLTLPKKEISISKPKKAIKVA